MLCLHCVHSYARPTEWTKWSRHEAIIFDLCVAFELDMWSIWIVYASVYVYVTVSNARVYVLESNEANSFNFSQ